MDMSNDLSSKTTEELIAELASHKARHAVGSGATNRQKGISRMKIQEIESELYARHGWVRGRDF